MAKISSKIEGVIERYRRELDRMGIRVSGVFLYGSQSCGRAHEGSDIDLVVISPDFKKMNFLGRMELLGVAAGRIEEPIQSYGFTPEELDGNLMPPFLSEILKHEAVPV
jgi:uncharacterized protein